MKTGHNITNGFRANASHIRIFTFVFVTMLIAGLLPMQQVHGQAQLSQNSGAHFLKGMHNQTTIINNEVQAPFKATGMIGVWNQTTALPRKVQHHEAVQYNNRMYVTGGMDVTQAVLGTEIRRISPKVYQATINNGLSNYVNLNDLPVGVMHHASVIANGHLFVIGGILEDSSVSNRIYHAKVRADGSITNWVLNPVNLPAPMWGHTVSLVNGYLIITGGCNIQDTSAVNTTYSVKVEPNGDLLTFTAQPAMPGKRNQHAATVFGNRVYITGGFDDNKLITSSVIYADVDLYGNFTAWQAAPNMPEPLYGHSATSDQGMMVVSGGYNDTLGFSVQYAYTADLTGGSPTGYTASILYYTHFANAASFINQGRHYVVGGLDIFNSTIERVYSIQLSSSATLRISHGVFTGEVFDLGVNRQVDTLGYTINNQLNAQFFYRTAQNGGTWSNWVMVMGTNKVPLNANLRYIQYRMAFNDSTTLNSAALNSVSVSFSAVQLSGIYLNATWTLANSPYWVTGDVIINGNVVIEPGVVLTFSEGKSLEVRSGTLTCNGTAALPVTFTSFTGDDGYWNGLHFTANSMNKASTLTHVIIENGGFLGHANLNCIGTNQPTINNGIIRNGTNSAVFCNNAWPLFNGIALENHQNYLIRLQTGGGPVFNSATLNNNALEKVHVLGGTLSNDAYWDNICPEYHVMTSLSTSNKTLVIEKGINLLFQTGTGITVNNGRLIAEGAGHPDSLIRFGALNGTPGGWTGININTTHAGGSIVKHADFKHGNTYNLNAQGSGILIEDCAFSQSANSGMTLSGNQINIKRSSFYSNMGRGIFSTGNNFDVFIDSCSFHQNGTHGLQLSGSVLITNSTLNNNTQTGLYLTGGTSSNNFEPQVENVQITGNGGNGIWVENCFPDFIYVDVLNNAGHGFVMNANVFPEYFNLNLTGNQTNDFRIDGGKITRNMTWGPGQYPMVVIGSFDFGNGAELTLLKGFTLRFAPNAGMSVGGPFSHSVGKLLAIGGTHPDSLITFTALNGQHGGWSGLAFGTYADTSLMKNCIIEKGVDNLTMSTTGYKVVLDSCLIQQASNRGIYASYSTEFALTNSLITQNHGNGIECGGAFLVNQCAIQNNGGHGVQGGGSFNIINTQISGNTGTGLRIVKMNNSTNEASLENLLIENNGTNGIWATDCSPDFVNVNVQNHPEHGFVMNANTWPSYFNLNLTGNNTNDFRVKGGNVERDITWAVGTYPYVVIETFSTQNNAMLTIEKGMTIRFAQNSGIAVGGNFSYQQGRLQAVGALHPDSMIRFTSLNGEPGGWAGISFATYARQSELINCIIEHAVDNLSFSGSSNYVTIDGTIIRGASNRGISGSNSSFTLRRSMVVNNNGYGIHLSGAAVPVIGDTLGLGNDIFNNTQYDIYNTSTNPVFARHNFFNSTDSAYLALRIFDKADNNSYGIVHLHPVSATSNFPFGQFISCKVRYHNNDSTVMNNTWVKLRDGFFNEIQTSKTNSEGMATFVMLPNDLYLLLAETTRPWGGGNATDALIIMQHFANLTMLTGIRQHVADVNMSQSINATDALNVLQRFAKLINTFPAGDWAFLADANPLSISGAHVNTNLWGLCMGDVNGSHIPGAGKSGNGTVSLTPSGTIAAEGTELTIPVYLQSPASGIGAISVNVRFPEEYLSIEEVTIPGSSTPAIYSVHDGVLSIAWCSLNPLTISGNDPLFTLRVVVRDQSVFKQTPWLVLVGSNELADAQAMPLPAASLTYLQPVKATGLEESMVYGTPTIEAWPNPAREQLTLSAALPEGGLFSYSVFTPAGALLMQSEEIVCTNGMHNESVDLSAMSTGMYIFRVQTSTPRGTFIRILKVTVY